MLHFELQEVNVGDLALGGGAAHLGHDLIRHRARAVVRHARPPGARRASDFLRALAWAAAAAWSQISEARQEAVTLPLQHYYIKSIVVAAPRAPGCLARAR